MGNRSHTFGFKVSSEKWQTGQLNENLGSGTVFSVHLRQNCNVSNFSLQLQKTMVIGIDCYHDSLTKGRSVGGFVASMNKTLTKYV